VKKKTRTQLKEEQLSDLRKVANVLRSYGVPYVDQKASEYISAFLAGTMGASIAEERMMAWLDEFQRQGRVPVE
jgi:hypothetical protein